MTSAAPPGGGYGTQTTDMQAAAAHVRQVNDSIQGELTALRGRLEPLAGAWVGQAAGQFAALMTRWHSDAAALRQALEGIGTQIQASGQSYENTEAAQSSGFSSITSVLG